MNPIKIGLSGLMIALVTGLLAPHWVGLAVIALTAAVLGGLKLHETEKNNEGTARLVAGSELQRHVFEVGADLVGICVAEELPDRFRHALETWWKGDRFHMWIADKGTWRVMTPGSPEKPPGEGTLVPRHGFENLILQLVVDDDTLGVCHLEKAVGVGALSDAKHVDHTSVAEIIRAQLALALRRALLYDTLMDLARHDQLTGTHRRWYGEERLRECLEEHTPIAVALLDIDHFKRVNDTFGHPMGDHILEKVGEIFIGNLRPTDLVMRYGGEEFVVLLENTPLDRAQKVIERLIEGVASMELPVGQITVSGGVSVSNVNDTLEALLERADSLAYQAKDKGGNQLISDE